MHRWPKSWRADAPGCRCPSCGTDTGRPVVRGMPTEELVQAVDRGELDVVFGGCCVTSDDPTHACSTCGVQFRPARGTPRPPAPGATGR